MKKALIVIDYTNDFVADDGKLTCGKPGQAIEGKICERINEVFRKDRGFVFVMNDFHRENDYTHPESKLFPAHNIAGTNGRELYGKVGDMILMAGMEDQVRSDSQIPHLYIMDKTRYSAFHGTNLEYMLRQYGINEIELCGVCTDICVLHTAVDAYNKGFKVTVHKDAVASFNPAGHEWALGHFQGSLGFEVL